jgi:Amt family ammonium transporter
MKFSFRSYSDRLLTNLPVALFTIWLVTGLPCAHAQISRYVSPDSLASSLKPIKAQAQRHEEQLKAVDDKLKTHEGQLKADDDRLKKHEEQLKADEVQIEEIKKLRERLDKFQQSFTDLQNKLILVGTTGAPAIDLQSIRTEIAGLQQGIGRVEAQVNAGVKPDDLARVRKGLEEIERMLQATPPIVSIPPAATGDLQEIRVALNIVWTLVAGFLVMFMQAGFAMVETGLTRAKNATHTMAMNFMVYALAMLGYWAIGFGLQMGGTGDLQSVSTVTTLGAAVGEKLNSEAGIYFGSKYFGFLGLKGFFLTPGLMEGGIFAFFLFQMVFMDTAATIPTGAMAERWRFKSFCLYAVAVGAFIYPVYANWVWGGGWLAALGKNFGLGHGHVDFAGSSVVHLCGGTIAYVGARMLKPRDGKFKGDNSDGTPNPIPPHNFPFAVLGTFILAFGWFGFNAGSTLSGMNTQIGVIATNTMLAAAAGAASGMIVTWKRYGYPDVGFMCNGMLAGLVAITASCAFVDSWIAVLIGALAGVLVVYSSEVVENKLKIDDPVSAISVHGVCGAWGVLALGLFANGRYGEGWNKVSGKVTGLCYGDGSQFVAQIIGAAVCVATVFWLARLFFWLIGRWSPHRADSSHLKDGLDKWELGLSAYPKEDLTPTPDLAEPTSKV